MPNSLSPRLRASTKPIPSSAPRAVIPSLTEVCATAQLPPTRSAVGRKLPTRVHPSSRRRRRSGSHIDALRSPSLGGRPSHSAAASHLRTRQTPSHWRSSQVRACMLLPWCSQLEWPLAWPPLALAPERRDVGRSYPPGRTFLLLCRDRVQHSEGVPPPSPAWGKPARVFARGIRATTGARCRYPAMGRRSRCHDASHTDSPSRYMRAVLVLECTWL
jgi:hypothetical protein